MCSDMCIMCLDHINQVLVWMRKAIISPHVYGFVAHTRITTIERQIPTIESKSNRVPSIFGRIASLDDDLTRIM